jgi:hypothetical protein
VNILEVQSNPAFDGATFLAASNFNCLEFMNENMSAGEGITRYHRDHTQGPYCALAAGPAILYRNYFVPHGGEIGQLAKELELLGDTPIAKYVQHGRPIIKDSSELAQYDWKTMDSKFLIGLHENCQVTTTQVGTKFADAPPGRIIHQVYAAAFDFRRIVVDDTMMEIARRMLTAEYKATILAAWEMSRKYPGRAGSNKLSLTLLGGGVFRNPFPLICDTIMACEEVLVQSGLEAYVVCYDDRSFANVHPLLRGMMERTGGREITSY